MIADLFNLHVSIVSLAASNAGEFNDAGVATSVSTVSGDKGDAGGID